MAARDADVGVWRATTRRVHRYGKNASLDSADSVRRSVDGWLSRFCKQRALRQEIRTIIVGKMVSAHGGRPVPIPRRIPGRRYSAGLFFVPEDKQVRLARVKARYSFEMQNSCITVIESDTKAFTIGQRSCWEILSIDSKSFTYEIVETGVTDSMTRLPATAPECPPLQ